MELNTSEFVVERSADGNHFLAIGDVAAAGNTELSTAYAFTDAAAGLQPCSILYYRLKIVDRDGQYSYSKIVSLPLNKNIDVVLFPNPVKQLLNLKISGSATAPVQLQISDLTGRVLFSQKSLGVQSNISIDVRQWKPQVYILKVVNSQNEVLITQKFQKL
jgi:hypothetical protein